MQRAKRTGKPTTDLFFLLLGLGVGPDLAVVDRFALRSCVQKPYEDRQICQTRAKIGTTKIKTNRKLKPRLLAQVVEAKVLLFETFGGAGPGVMRLLRKLSDEVSNRLSHAQYDQTSWSARNWRTYQTQRLSVVLQLAAVEEIMRELGLAAGRAVDPGDQRAA